MCPNASRSPMARPWRPRAVQLAAAFCLGWLALPAPLNAQENEEPDGMAAQTLVVAADGSGDFATIQEALDSAAPGDEVRVRPGVYREALRLPEGVRLAGDDRETCVVEWPGTWTEQEVWDITPHPVGMPMGATFDPPAAKDGAEREPAPPGAKPRGPFQGEAQPLLAEEGLFGEGGDEGLEAPDPLDWEGSSAELDDAIAAAAILYAEEVSGSVENLSFRVKKWHGGLQPPAGLVLFNASVRVENCSAENFGVNLAITGEGAALAKGCRFSGARFANIDCADASGAVLEGNACEGSEFGPGIRVSGDAAKPTIARGNACRNNRLGGIAVANGSRAEIGGNACEDNGEDGVNVSGGARPLLKGNACRGNQGNGVAYRFESGGLAENNACENNRLAGISVEGQGAEPTLRGNACVGNGSFGIVYDEGAGGLAEGNVCEGNGGAGIFVLREGTAPTLRRNVCENNKGPGLQAGAETSATLEANVSQGNEGEGLSAGLSALPGVE